MVSYGSAKTHSCDHFSVEIDSPSNNILQEIVPWQVAFDLLENTPVAMALVRQGKIRFLTQALAEIIGRPAREVEGTSFLQYLHPEDIPYIQRVSPDIHRSVISRLRVSGRNRWIKLSFATPGKDASDSGDLLVTVEDVSELRNLRWQQYRTLQDLLDLFSHSLIALGKTLAIKDPYTQLHHVRVSRLAFAMAKMAGLSEDGILTTTCAAFMHDIGKIAVPSAILSKPGRLTREEYETIKIHPQVGASIVGEIPFTLPIKRTILQHHERFDGSGYPNGLEGEQILTEARVLAVADVMEALTADRPYRSALSYPSALEEITKARGSQFEPFAVDVCLKVFQEGFSFEVDSLGDNPEVKRYIWRKIRSKINIDAY